MRRTRDFAPLQDMSSSRTVRTRLVMQCESRTPYWMPAASSMTRFFGASAARSVLLSFQGIQREWGRTANPEYNVLTTAEVTDMLLDLKLLHMTREIVRL